MNVRDCIKEGLLRKVRPSPETAEKELCSARRYLENAVTCLENKMPEMAVVAVYTAMFHSCRSLLFRDGYRERSHVCVIVYLSEHYPGLKTHLQTVDIYRRSRHQMLYGVEIDALEEDARQGISATGKLMAAIEEELKKPVKGQTDDCPPPA